MSDVAWGAPIEGVRFGIQAVAPGEPLILPCFVENQTGASIFVFGWNTSYPRSLRVSPPKPHRPYVRVSFTDTNVLHPPDGFLKVAPGQFAETTLDVSFALDLSVVGAVDLAFAYDPVKAQVITGWTPPEGATAITSLISLTPA